MVKPQSSESGQFISQEITSYSQELSRRDFLKAAGIVTGSALLAACTPKAVSTGEPATEINPTAKSIEAPASFAGQNIDSNYLLSGINSLPANPISVPDSGNSNQVKGKDTDYTKQHFDLDFINKKNPLDILKLTVAIGPWLGTEGGVT